MLLAYWRRLLMHRKEEGGVTEEDLVQCLDMISGFILRRYVCSESSRGYYLWFVSACRDLEHEPVEKLKSFFMDKGYPDDARFEKCLLRFQLYQSDYGHYVLEKLERSYEHREAPDLSQAQIEHIMPQTLNEEWKNDLGPEYEQIYSEWLHTLGNLTLSAYNKELYNHAFHVKRDRYEHSNIALTRQLATEPSWGEAELLARGTKLAQRAKEIWIGP
jgi:hypothetical protein